MRKHLAKGAGNAWNPALHSGRHAVALGLETLQLAVMHQNALAALQLSPIGKGINEEAQLRWEELGLSNRVLLHEVARRKTSEKSLKQSEQHQIRLLKESRFMEAQLHNLLRQVLDAQEVEFKRIGRELHDFIAQTTTCGNVRLSVLSRQVGHKDKTFDDCMAKTQKLVFKAVDNVHQFSRQLRPAVLDDLGLVPALHSFMNAFSTNVVRHAHSSRVDVRIEKLGEDISMRIMDNGRPFKRTADAKAKASKRLGLLGMRVRIEMIGGKYSIEATPGKGTGVIALEPVSTN
ncbi:MAG: sensor histidine kinase [Limisphaerales bacterium]